MGISWVSLILGAAVAVAVATTLIVEYAAKPRLEARKERILENARGSRTLLAQLHALEWHIWILDTDLKPGGRDPDTAINRLMDEIDDIISGALAESVLPYELAVLVLRNCGKIVGYLAGYRAGWEAVVGSTERIGDTDTFSEVVHETISSAHISLAINYLCTKKRQFRVRRDLRERARQIMDSIYPDGVLSAAD